MPTVVLDSGQIAAARRRLTALAEQAATRRAEVVSASPLVHDGLAAGGRVHAATQWLEEQVAGLRDLEDLARVLETTGAEARYEGDGSFAEATHRLGPEIARVLGELDPADPADLQALGLVAGLLQRHAGDPVVEDALLTHVGGTGLLDAFTRLVPPGPPADASPEDVAAWWAGLTAAQQLAATLVQSRTYGNLDGLPAATRDLANRKNLPEYRQELLALLDDPSSFDPDHDPGLIETLMLDGDQFQVQEKLRALAEMERIIGLGDRQLLLLDPFDGEQLHAAVAVGDVDTADHVAVFTPGFTSTVQDSLSGYDAKMLDLQGLSAREARLRGDGGSVATITWMGYDAPQVHEVGDLPRSVTMPDLARDGGADLSTFYAGINATRADDPHLTALGHSYGSLATGYALQREGTGVDDAVLFGSPGTGTWDRHDLRVPDGHLFLEEADDDPVADLGGTAPFGRDPSQLDGVTFLSTDAADLPDGSRGEQSTGHSRYLSQDTTAQYNLAVTVIGEPDLQVRTDAPPVWTGRFPDGDFYSSVPGLAHDGYEAGVRGLEATGEALEEGFGAAWDRLGDVRLHNPIPKVPW